MPGEISQWGVFEWGRRQWAKAWEGLPLAVYPDYFRSRRTKRRDPATEGSYVEVFLPIDLYTGLYPEYPDLFRSRRTRRRDPAIEGGYTEVLITPPSIDALTAIYTKLYDDIVPKFKHRTYLHPVSFTTSATSLGDEQQGIEWQPEYPDIVYSRSRVAYLTGGMAPKTGHTVRVDAAVATMAELFGGDWPDYIAPNKKRVYGMAFFIAPVRNPVSLWTEPAITAVTTVWTEPAVTPTVDGAVLQ